MAFCITLSNFGSFRLGRVTRSRFAAVALLPMVCCSLHAQISFGCPSIATNFSALRIWFLAAVNSLYLSVHHSVCWWLLPLNDALGLWSFTSGRYIDRDNHKLSRQLSTLFALPKFFVMMSSQTWLKILSIVFTSKPWSFRDLLTWSTVWQHFLLIHQHPSSQPRHRSIGVSPRDTPSSNLWDFTKTVGLFFECVSREYLKLYFVLHW